MLKLILMVISMFSLLLCDNNGVPPEQPNADNNKREYLHGTPVVYEDFGRTICDSIFDDRLNRYVLFYTALDFYYNNQRYYISIADSIKLDNLLSKQVGDTLFVDIVLLDSTLCNPDCSFIDNRCAYITKIADSKE